MDYWPKAGRNPIAKWYGTQDDEVRAEFDVTVHFLEETEDWETDEVKEFKQLTGEHLGLSEIKLKVGKRKFRLLGIYLPEQRQFVFLAGLEKSGRVRIPDDAFEVALEYKRRFEAGEGFTYEHR